MASVEAPPSDDRRSLSPAATEAPLAWTSSGGLLLVIFLLVGGFAVLSSAVILVFGSTNNTDWALYLLTLVTLVPAALVGGRPLARAADSVAGPNAACVLAVWTVAGLLLVVLLARVTFSLGGSSSVVLLPLVPVLGASVLWMVRSAREGRRPGSTMVRGGLRRPGILTAVLACACTLAFLSPELFHPPQLVASLAIATALTALHVRFRPYVRARRVGLLIDAAILAAVILTITDVSGYLEYVGPNAKGAGFAFSHRHHEGFFLGPLNDVLHGRAMLVDTWSQYGVGVFYFLAAFFALAPLGYGTLGLLAGFLIALQYALAYGVMRLTGCARTLAVPAIAAATVGLLLGAVGSPNDVPSIGALRFGIPWLIVALAVSWARWPRRRSALQGAAAVLVGVAAVWSFETFAYAAATLLAIAGFEAASTKAGEPRLHALARFILPAAALSLLAHLLLAVGTRAFAGSWPSWSTYLAFLKLYSGDTLITIPVPPWSPGLVVLLSYLASAIVLAALLTRRHPLVLERRPALLGIAATSGLGIASFTYFVGNSHPNNVLTVALPAVVGGCLWASLLGERASGVPPMIGVAALAMCFWVAALVAIPGWPEATAKWRRMALAQTIPDGGRGGSIRYSLPRLWRSPPSDPRAPDAQALLDRHLPPGAPALVILEPELTIETLVRSDRVNLLPISHPEQDNLIPAQADPRVRRAVDRLRPGTLMLTQPAAFDTPIKPPAANVPAGLVRLQKLALNRIRARFRLRDIESTPSGIAIVELVAPSQLDAKTREPPSPRPG